MSTSTTTTSALPPHAQRKYADLIFTGSRLQWSSFEPLTPIQPGDYGLLSPETGAFSREGNIYSEGYAEKYGIRKAEEVVPGSTSEKGLPAVGHGLGGVGLGLGLGGVGGEINSVVDEQRECWTISKNARALTYGKDCKVPDKTIQTYPTRGHIAFTSDRGAVLTTLSSQTLSIPNRTSLKSLISEPSLSGKHLVAEVTRCAAYARYLSSEKGGSVTMGYDGTKWEARGVKEEEGDRWDTGVSPEGERLYTPLFRLLVIRDRGPILLLRDSPEPEDPRQLLAPLYPPWGVLDEKGEQVPGAEWGGSEEDFMREVEEEERRWGVLSHSAADEEGGKEDHVPASPPASV